MHACQVRDGHRNDLRYDGDGDCDGSGDCDGNDDCDSDGDAKFSFCRTAASALLDLPYDMVPTSTIRLREICVTCDV
jgi:hypothetical protein